MKWKKKDIIQQKKSKLENIDIASTMLEASNYRRNPYYSGSSDYFRVLINPAKKLIIESNLSSFTRWTTTLEYTKTTDSPSS